MSTEPQGRSSDDTGERSDDSKKRGTAAWSAIQYDDNYSEASDTPLLPPDVFELRVTVIAEAQPGHHYKEFDERHVRELYLKTHGDAPLPKNYNQSFKKYRWVYVHKDDLPRRCSCMKTPHRTVCVRGYHYLMENKDGGELITRCKDVNECPGHRYTGQKGDGRALEAGEKNDKVCFKGYKDSQMVKSCRLIYIGNHAKRAPKDGKETNYYD
ncbi:hypothetical protein K491DRAFT_730272 [Lophiostoma macrostomum CBS 122681]|uniref:Uncharacterized protein n=1 Tax=Lophiostoma macrostomum CBS 122681 TaxID=1314788 RepID=A0A6A6TK32_9PLEO|nr:hypothetical protein K491DRAFT_730272 [Lophiostoma macrostomum CBS 122681]